VAQPFLAVLFFFSVPLNLQTFQPCNLPTFKRFLLMFSNDGCLAGDYYAGRDRRTFGRICCRRLLNKPSVQSPDDALIEQVKA
jgi:hypothetical protein